MNTTATTPDNENDWLGFLSLFIAVVLFGTNYIPVKRVRTGDGVFFQFVMCVAIFMTGLVIGFAQGFPRMYPEAMLGGFLWATGNVMVVPIVHTIGLGLGLLLWASSTTINGWASGRFGLFGINAQIPTDIPMNYAGVALALLSTLLFVFIKPHDEQHDSVDNAATLTSRAPSVHSLLPREKDPIIRSHTSLLPNQVDGGLHESLPLLAKESDIRPQESLALQTLHKLSPEARRALGITLAIGSGIIYGFQFTPVIYIQDHPDIYPNAPPSTLDYIFTFYVGIFASSTIYFFLYCVVMRRHTWISDRLIVPAFVCGTMWAIAEAALMVAIAYLSEAISFPIAASMPALISALLGVFVFKEIRGARNLAVLGVACVTGVTGAILTGLSK